jgi:hypothetical protein
VLHSADEESCTLYKRGGMRVVVGMVSSGSNNSRVSGGA